MPGRRSGSKLREALNREIGEPGKNRSQIAAHCEFSPAAAFHDRQNRRNLRPCQWTADVYPVLPSIEIFRYSELCSLPDYVQSASPGCLSNHEQPAFEWTSTESTAEHLLYMRSGRGGLPD